jgi:hypothetical protein
MQMPNVNEYSRLGKLKAALKNWRLVKTALWELLCPWTIDLRKICVKQVGTRM